MYDKIKIRFIFWILFIVSCAVAMFMDLFFIGVLVPLLYYSIKKESLRRTLPGVISGIIFGVFGLLSAMLPFVYLTTGDMAEEMYSVIGTTGMTAELMLATPTFAIGCFLGAILIRNYNGERGKPAKWLFYIVYPLHMAVIALIAVILGITQFNLFGFISL